MNLSRANRQLRAIAPQASIEYRPSRQVPYVVRIGTREVATAFTVLDAYHSALRRLEMLYNF